MESGGEGSGPLTRPPTVAPNGVSRWHSRPGITWFQARTRREALPKGSPHSLPALRTQFRAPASTESAWNELTAKLASVLAVLEEDDLLLIAGNVNEPSPEWVESDPDFRPTYFLDIELRLMCVAMAERAVATLREVYRIHHPREL